MILMNNLALVLTFIDPVTSCYLNMYKYNVNSKTVLSIFHFLGKFSPLPVRKKLIIQKRISNLA